MQHTKQIQIDTLLPQSAEKRAKAAEIIANTLDDNNMQFLADLCQKKGKAINNSITANQSLIEAQL